MILEFVEKFLLNIEKKKLRDKNNNKSGKIRKSFLKRF